MEKIDKSKPYGCELCKTAFELPTLLKNHMSTHADLFKFKCKFCESSFLSKQNLIYHERRHSSIRPFDCKICQKTFRSRNKWIEHKRLHTEETPFQCTLCDESFTTANLLRNHHAQIHTGHRMEYGKIEPHPYQCNECDERFQLEYTLLNHKIVHHFENKDYENEYSGKTKQVRKYINSLQISKYGARGRNFNLQRRKRNINLCNRKRVHKCFMCERTFNSPVTLQKHKVCHYRRKTFKCDECDKQFRSHGSLTTHRKSHLNQLFECHICHQQFNTRNNLDLHLVCHPSDKPYGCQLCSMSFRLAVDLKVHLRSHSHERLFRCLLCPLTYKHYSHLKQHIKNKHPEAENHLLQLSSDETSSTAESDSAETEIYMIQSAVEDIDVVLDETLSSKTSAQKFNEEKAPITFLFRGRLEGQKSVGKKKDSNKAKNETKVQMDQHLEQNEFLDQVELWDKGLSQNAYGPDRRNGRITATQNNNTGSFENTEISDTFQNHTHQTGTYTSTNTGEPVRQHMMDLPILSNYGDTDNLLSWPSPLQTTFFEHFDSFSETEFPEGCGMPEEKTGRKLIKNSTNCFPFVSNNEGVETTVNREITHKMHINPALDNRQRVEGEGIPEIVMNDLSEKGGQQFADILDEILGDTYKGKNGVSDDKIRCDISNNNTSMPPGIENKNKLKPKNNFVFKNTGCINKGNNEEHRNVESYMHVRNIVSDNFARDCEGDRLTKEENHKLSKTCNGKSINNISYEKVQSEISIRNTKDFLNTTLDTYRSENGQSTLDTNKLKKGQWIETSDPNIKFSNKHIHDREGQFIKVDRKISFFVTKTSSVNESSWGDADSVDSDIADWTTVEGNGTSIMCSDNDSVRSCHNSSLNDASTISDIDDDAKWDSYSADESIVDDSVAFDTSTDEALNTSECISTSNISAEESSTESDTETTTDYDNDENPMTDNCSSQDTDDEINFNHQKEHTVHCLKKKTRWLKRNFKFKKSMLGSKHCVSYAVYKKNYADFTKLTFRRSAAEIEKKYGGNKYMTEEKIARIREMIKKKHFAKPAYTSDDSSVEASEKSIPMVEDDIVPFAQEQMRIASPRYKTSYTLEKIHEKHVHHNSNIHNVTGTTVVKSNVNVQYNKMASPRYKTRYAKLKLAKENGHIKCDYDERHREKETSYCEMSDRCVGNKTLRFVIGKSNSTNNGKPTSKESKRKSKCNGFVRSERDILDATKGNSAAEWPKSSAGEEIRRPTGKRRKLESDKIKTQPDDKNLHSDKSNTGVNKIIMTFKLGTKQHNQRKGRVKCFGRTINKMQGNDEDKIMNADFQSAKTGTDCESDVKIKSKNTGMLTNRNESKDDVRKRKSDGYLIANSNNVSYLDGIYGKETSCKDEKSFCTNYTLEQSADEVEQVHGSEKEHLKNEDDLIKNNELTRPKLETQYSIKDSSRNYIQHVNVSPDIFKMKEEIENVQKYSYTLDVKCKTQPNVQHEYYENIHHRGSNTIRNSSDKTLQGLESNDRTRFINDQKEGRRRLSLYDKYQAITHWSSLGYFKKKKKEVDKDVPYMIGGYKTSGPDLVVPPFENTRLKCKEREGTDKERYERSSRIGLNNLTGDNMLYTHRSRIKGRSRSRQKQRRPKVEKQKRKKDNRSSSNGFTLSTESTRIKKTGDMMSSCQRSFMEILSKCGNISNPDATPHSSILYDKDLKGAQCNSSWKPSAMTESTALSCMTEIQNLSKVTKSVIDQEQTTVNKSSFLQQTGAEKEHVEIKPDVGKKLRRTMEEVVKALLKNSLAEASSQTLPRDNNLLRNWKEIFENQPTVKLKRIDK